MSLTLNFRNLKPTFYFKVAYRDKLKRQPQLKIKKIKSFECCFNPRSNKSCRSKNENRFHYTYQSRLMLIFIFFVEGRLYMWKINIVLKASFTMPSLNQHFQYFQYFLFTFLNVFCPTRLESPHTILFTLMKESTHSCIGQYSSSQCVIYLYATLFHEQFYGSLVLRVHCTV